MKISVSRIVETNGQKITFSAEGEWDDWGVSRCYSETGRLKEKREAAQRVVDRVRLLFAGLDPEGQPPASALGITGAESMEPPSQEKK